ncbi:MAG: putative quinol monooxygenase [Pseudomonadota bacterium]
MIIVAGYIELEAAGADGGEALARAMMAETRKEAGCVVYQITRSVERPSRYHVYEEWESLAALEAHFEVPHMKVFREGLGRIGVVERNVSRREAGEATAL